LLLDEPDEHLHPNNQVLLCNAIKLLSAKMNLQVIMSTHSRHVISALEAEAKFIWMKNGEVCCDDQSFNLHNVLLDLGALDVYDSILQGKFSLVVLTEDGDTKYLKKLLEYNGCDMTSTLIIPYNSSSHIDAAIQLANFIKSAAQNCKIIIHRDRDFMTDDEVQVIKTKVEEEEQLLWVTDDCDVEAYFTTVEHIAEITEKTIDEVIEWQNAFLVENHVEIQHKFEEKRKVICTTMYNSDGKLKKKKEISRPSFATLFGNTVPTSRQNVVGKFMLKKCNENMSKLCNCKVDLLRKTDALIIASLQDVINKA
jgi:ABC-type multidrug transport system ATPase subunit